jgi:SAM-dependent methyltransferase
MCLLEEDIEYFNNGDSGKEENEKFWSRFGRKPDLTGKTTLDVGCGHGSLCVNMALSGAKKVVGVDINTDLINFAKENLKTNYPQLLEIVEFYAVDLNDYSKEEHFDYIVSKDSFEHIIDLPSMIEAMKLRLKPGGMIYTGFGPLYNDFYGDHKRTECKIPWRHVICSDEKIIRRLNKTRQVPIQSIFDLGLNKLSLADYRRIFKESGLKIVFFKVNQSEHFVLKLFKLISFLFPFLKEYFAHNIYAILKKQE